MVVCSKSMQNQFNFNLIYKLNLYTAGLLHIYHTLPDHNYVITIPELMC
jgi:hypothetical protein